MCVMFKRDVITIDEFIYSYFIKLSRNHELSGTLILVTYVNYLNDYGYYLENTTFIPSFNI